SFKHRQQALSYRIKKVKDKQSFLPHKRARFFQRIPLEFQFVQKWRMIVRQKSLELWGKTRNAEIFEKELLRYKKRLATFTRLYHRLQRVKKKLGFKTI